jgi:hypothetical protein
LPLRDDAGIDRELLPMGAQPSGTARLDRVRDRAYLVYGEITNFGKLMIRILVLLIPMAIAMPLLVLWLRPKGVPIPVVGAGVAVPLIGAAIALTKRDFRKLATRAPEIADAYLDEGICPCCGYNLAGVVRAADAAASGQSLVQCTECGASWSRSRIHRVETEETAEARETTNFRTLMRAQAMLYSSMAFKDDAGKSVSLARFSDLKALRARVSGSHRERLEACIGKLRFKGLWVRILFASILVPISIGIIVELVRVPAGAIGVMHGLKAIGLVLWTIGAVAIIGSDIGRSGAKRALLLKSTGLCPCCGAELQASNGNDTGDLTCVTGDVERVVHCTECRAAWNLPKKDEAGNEVAVDSPRVEAR